MIKTHSVYYPLYQNKDKFIILVTGGRGSGKSFGVGAFIERLTFEMEHNGNDVINHQVLYTRYTMVSANISVIPEFMEKIQLDGTEKYFKTTRGDVVNTATGGRIMFRGIKTSSGNQTAKLKSIKGITTFVVDEAEEWTSEEDFERIMLSIRQKGIQNRIIIIMNPSDCNHFVYKRFIRDTHKLVDYDGVPVQISTHPNVLHIHTSYLDNEQFLSEQFLKAAKATKVENPARYAHIFMGQWSDASEAAIFKHWGVIDEFPEYAKHICLAIDWGYTNDPTAIVRCGMVDNRLYIEELCYKTEMLSSDIIKEIRKHDGTYNYVVCDSADPRLIQEVANGGILIYPVVKGAGSILAGIEKMLDLEIFITKNSFNIEEELRNYTWEKDKDGHLVNQPIDAFNHCFVGETLVATDKGEKRIDSVREGDMVLTSDGYCKVTRFFDQGVKRTITALLKFDDMAIKITATPDHKFRVGNRWQRFDSLQKGDLLTVCGIGKKQLKGVVVTQYKERQVYDIEVERKHEFFANGILVHNCIDASRYYVLSELLGQVKKPNNVNKDMLGIF